MDGGFMSREDVFFLGMLRTIASSCAWNYC